MNSRTKNGEGRKARFKPDDKDQSKLFIEKAREIEADRTESASDELLGRLAKEPPQPRRGAKMSEIEVKQISNPSDIPEGIEYVLVMRGAENENIQHSQGVTIKVARIGGSDLLDESAFHTAVESAKKIATRQQISTVFVCR